eukprot:gene17900-biopygen5154
MVGNAAQDVSSEVLGSPETRGSTTPGALRSVRDLGEPLSARTTSRDGWRLQPFALRQPVQPVPPVQLVGLVRLRLQAFGYISRAHPVGRRGAMAARCLLCAAACAAVGGGAAARAVPSTMRAVRKVGVEGCGGRAYLGPHHLAEPSEPAERAGRANRPNELSELAEPTEAALPCRRAEPIARRASLCERNRGAPDFSCVKVVEDQKTPSPGRGEVLGLCSH